ncbi:ParB/RepB/Spo0J family partition protein [Psychromarinibacter sp. C21-152]|uniref:ParB/RepB/Spo0J family partition protein n=1 Tax=Psychromarinibacter sediminicola TaxID=3033385 RepID=A0AAE3NZH5_9RHOB|nr:ParB/RepB/Spo0J family partition protein [Psychromarinibacter sediminicola]MDF0603780.1 ParB/RepB/Spo0J family partition protein [Psychromarinibacter sediminicola]
MRIPTDQIDPHALPRDRTVLDADALDELQRSILANGLRQPIEVWQTDTGYALLSGYRRLMAVTRLHEATEQDRWTEIDAVLRSPPDRVAAMAAMVEENEVRQALSPWERAAVAVASVDAGTFDTVDAALRRLYPFLNRQKRARLRAVAEVVEELDGLLTDPEDLSEQRLQRIAAAIRLGWSELITAALAEVRRRSPCVQWETLAPVLAEAESVVATGGPTSPNRPKRLSTPRPGVHIRRERTRRGFVLHVTGQGATDALVTEILDEVERLFS